MHYAHDRDARTSPAFHTQRRAMKEEERKEIPVQKAQTPIISRYANIRISQE